LRARKLYVVVPKLTTDNSDDGVLMDDSVYPQMGGADPSSPEGTTRTVAPVDSPNHSSDSAYS